MAITHLGGMSPSPYLCVLDLNDLLLDHPAASFIFQLGDDLAIADRAAQPKEHSLVIVEHQTGFTTEHYHGQQIFGVIVYLIRKTI